MKEQTTLKRLSVLLAICFVAAMVLTACKHSGEHPKGEHPKKAAPATNAPPRNP